MPKIPIADCIVWRFYCSCGEKSPDFKTKEEGESWAMHHDSMKCMYRSIEENWQRILKQRENAHV